MEYTCSTELHCTKSAIISIEAKKGGCQYEQKR